MSRLVAALAVVVVVVVVAFWRFGQADHAGAALAGRIQPLDILPQLSGEPGLGRGRKLEPGVLSGAFLRRPGTMAEHPSGSPAAPIAADGSFRIEGVPAGTWELHLRYAVPIGENSWTNQSHRIAHVELTDGLERRENYDVSHLLGSELEGALTLDGKPLEEASVELEGTRVGPDGESEVNATLTRVQSGGRFRMAPWPADYRLIAHFTKNGQPFSMAHSEVFRLAPTQKLRRSFDLESSVLKLRVLASDGVTPVSGVSLRCEFPKASSGSQSTDVDGGVEIAGLPAVEVAVTTWRKNLATIDARVQFAHARNGNLEGARVTVATLTIPPPETIATIVLPASAGY